MDDAGAARRAHPHPAALEGGADVRAQRDLDDNDGNQRSGTGQPDLATVPISRCPACPKPSATLTTEPSGRESASARRPQHKT